MIIEDLHDSDKGGYQFLEHMADAEIEAFGSSLEQAFENAARALEDTMVDIGKIRPRLNYEIAVQGGDESELLYAWLESLIFKEDTENLLFSKFQCKISRESSKYELHARVAGERFDPNRHQQKTAVKAPTYHEMRIERGEKAGQTFVKIKFVLDL